MTILPVKAHAQKKDDAVQQRQENTTREARSSRQRHGARERSGRIHNSDIQRNQSVADYPFWNVIDSPTYNEIDINGPRDAPVPVEVQVHPHPQIVPLMPENASTSEDLSWRLESPINPSVETVSPESPNETSSQPWHRGASCDVENKPKLSKKSGDKKVCVKRRQRRTSPYSKIRQKHARTNVHTLKTEASTSSLLTSSAIVTTPRTSNICNTGQVKNNNNVIKCNEKVNFNDESDRLTPTSHQAQKSTTSASCGNEAQRSSKKAEKSPKSDDKDGYESGESDTKHNSDDEYDPMRLTRLHKNVNFAEIEQTFEKRLKDKRGFVIKPMTEDGACLFRAVSDQVYGDQNMHDVVRKSCMDYMLKNADFFKHYVTEDFASYILRKRKNHTHGNHLEIQAMAELYNRPFEVYQYSIDPINTFQSSHRTDNVPVRLSYHQNSHYNSVIDPYKATVGVGLGLPSFKPGSADENLLKTVQCDSERQVLEEQMFQDKVQATDWESTEEAVLKHVAIQSYKQYVESNISSNTNKAESSTKKAPKSEKVIETTESKPSSSASKPYSSSGASNCVSDWIEEEEEWQVLSRVMAASQQEYIDSFKQSKPTCSKYT